MKVKNIKFQGAKMLLVGGAITFKEDFENFRESYAHLCDDGKIRRHGDVIGTKDDIEICKEDK